MRRWVLVAGLIAAAAASPALAADLGGGPPYRWSGPYGGPYGAPYSNPYERPRYAPRAAPRSYGDDDDDEGDGYDSRPPARTYSYAPPRHSAPRPGRICVHSAQVRDRLTSEGWRDFHDGKPVGDGLVTMRARRPNGQLFELTLHRCTGETVNARAMELTPFGPYAYRQPYGPYGAWRWSPESAPYGYARRRWEERPYAYRGPRRWDGD